jgi:hypothetical protein
VVDATEEAQQALTQAIENFTEEKSPEEYIKGAQADLDELKKGARYLRWVGKRR